MAAAFGERQRAEQFARLLDSLDASPHGSTGVATLIPEQAPDPELVALLRVVEDIIDEGRFHGPVVSPEFKTQLGARLHREFHELYNADVDGPGDGELLMTRHRNPWRRRLIGGGVAVGVLSGGLGGVAWAASTALPGDPLYGVKRGLENMRVSVSGSDLERGEQYLGQTKTRLDEIHHLQGRHDSNVDGSENSRLISGALDNMYKDMNDAGQLLAPLAEAGNTEALTNLQNFLTVYTPQVQDLQTLVAPESQDKAQRLLSLMNTLADRMNAARAAIEHQRAAQTHTGSGPSTPAHRSETAPNSAPTGTAAPPGADGQRAPGSGAPDPAQGNAAPPAATPDRSLNLSVPIGSPATTVQLPPLLSGLPPIGITIGNSSPATGPTTDAGPPPSDPNPN